MRLHFRHWIIWSKCDLNTREENISINEYSSVFISIIKIIIQLLTENKTYDLISYLQHRYLHSRKCDGICQNIDLSHSSLSHWGRVTPICVMKLTILGSDNGLPPGRRQAITWINAGILLIEPIGTKFSEISIEIHIFSFKKLRLKMLSAQWRWFCPGLNVLRDFLLTFTYREFCPCPPWGLDFSYSFE